MSTRHRVCRLCCDTVQENNAEIINEDSKGMLQSVLTTIVSIKY